MADTLGLQSFVDACWYLCDDGWQFRFFSDQWWAITATCESHGSFVCKSANDSDLEETLSKLFAQIEVGHHG